MSIYRYSNSYWTKNSDKLIVLNNIIFKDINVHTWHRIEFNNCEFINSTFINYKQDNIFKNTSFYESNLQLNVLKEYSFKLSTLFTECNFANSSLKHQYF